MDDEEELRELLMQYEEEHRDLDQIIAQLMSTPPVDFIRLQRMKKRKLKLKDEIAQIKSALLPDIIA